MIFEEALYEGGPAGARDLWKAEIRAPRGLGEDAAQAVADAIEGICVSVLLRNAAPEKGDAWSVTATLAARPRKGEIAALLDAAGIAPAGLSVTCAPLEEKDWLQHVHRDFPPIAVGGFYVRGTHWQDPPPPGFIPLRIDAAAAFGSGEHPTTQGCLLALEALAKTQTPRHILDMGCGSGILAVAMAKLWPGAGIIAIDIDPESVAVTRRHARMNGVEHRIRAACGDGYAAPGVAEKAPYDLVAANILSGPLVRMAPALAAVLAPGGHAVLSGLLARQAGDVRDAHAAAGLALVAARDIGEWQALVLRKSGA